MKISPFVQENPDTLMRSLVKDMPLFQERATKILLAMEPKAIEFVESLDLHKRLHDIKTYQELENTVINPIYPEFFTQLAAEVDAVLVEDDTAPISVLLYIECGKQLMQGVVGYVREQFRQRAQALLGGKPTSNIITPPSIIMP